MSMKRTAFLVLAHQQPEMLKRLASRLNTNWSHTYIHLDAKADGPVFLRALDEYDNVTFLPNAQRVSVNWCGFSMVSATMNLLRAAFDDERAYERFFLLSGADYPIRPLSEIGRIVAADAEFISVDRALSRSGRTTFDRSANRVFLGDNLLLNSRSPIPLLGKAARVLEIGFTRPWPPGVSLHQGSSWWCLTRAAIAEVLALQTATDSYIPWFRKARLPEEMLFQTIIMASSRRPHITPKPPSRGEGTVADRGASDTHYLDWDRPNPSAPRTLDISDLDKILASPAMFARKFDIDRSRELLNRLDDLRG